MSEKSINNLNAGLICLFSLSLDSVLKEHQALIIDLS